MLQAAVCTDSGDLCYRATNVGVYVKGCYFSSALASSSLISLGNIPAKSSSSSSSFLPLLRVEAKERASFRYFLMGQFFESTSGSVMLPFAEQERQDLPCLTSRVCSWAENEESVRRSLYLHLAGSGRYSQGIYAHPVCVHPDVGTLVCYVISS